MEIEEGQAAAGDGAAAAAEAAAAAAGPAAAAGGPSRRLARWFSQGDEPLVDMSPQPAGLAQAAAVAAGGGGLLGKAVTAVWQQQPQTYCHLLPQPGASARRETPLCQRSV